MLRQFANWVFQLAEQAPDTLRSWNTKACSETFGCRMIPSRPSRYLGDTYLLPSIMWLSWKSCFFYKKCCNSKGPELRIDRVANSSGSVIGNFSTKHRGERSFSIILTTFGLIRRQVVYQH